MTQPGNRQTEKVQVGIDQAKRGNIEVPGVTKLRPSMILAACYSAAAKAITFAIDKAGLRATEKGAYGQIDTGEGTRVQYAASLPGDYAIVGGAQGMIAALGSAMNDVAECFIRLIDQTTGSVLGNMFFTPIGAGHTFETALVNRRTGQITNLLAQGFTQVVVVPVLGGLVGVRATDTTGNRNRQLYFLPFAKLAAGQLSVENWIASNAIGAAILGLPWRMTAQNVGQVLARTADGFECINLQDIGTGKISSLAEQAIRTTDVQHVLGETADPTQVVVADKQGNTHFVPAQSFRAAVTEVQQAQI